jgi:hypothetical protein
MSLSTVNPAMRGQVQDHARGDVRSRVWPGHPTKWSVALTGAYADGVFSFLFNGTLVSVTMAGSSLTGAAAALGAKADSLAVVVKVAESTADGDTLYLEARNLDQTFTLTTPIVPGGVTMTLTDVTEANSALRPGLMVALNDDGQLRKLVTGDTERLFFGVTAINAELDSSTGDSSAVDQWSVGASVDVVTQGEIPVAVEEAVTSLDNAVYVREVNTGAEENGAFRISADGGDTQVLANARWTSLSYTDANGDLVAMLLLK